MKRIRALIGRRRFLAAAGITSASALALGKFRGIFSPVFGTGEAEAAERAAGSDIYGVSDRYSHLLSPLKVGNVVLKNRMLVPQSTPYFLMGPEKYPSEYMRHYYINMAKNGAAVISVRIIEQKSLPANMKLAGYMAHMLNYDLEDYGVQNYLDQMVEGIHIYGSKACADLQMGVTMMMMGAPKSADPDELLEKATEKAIKNAAFYRSHGFDAFQLGVRGNEPMSLALCKAVKKAFPDMLIVTEVFVKEPSITPHTRDMYYTVGLTLDDAINYAKSLEGYADILMIRIADSSAAHPTTWNSIKGKPYTIRYSEAIKKSGAKIITAPGGGYQDPGLNEKYIAEGKADMLTMARAFICDWEYGKKITAGKGEDVVPCIRCNKCHGENKMNGPWYTVCSVNPKIGIPMAVRSIPDPGPSKRVAVIGGGPAGMKAAVTAAERGHTVTLYEKSSSLGGLLRHADYSPYKWAIRDFKDFLIRQVEKAGVEVLLNTTATPETIKSKSYDSILVAVGSEPVVPDIPGADGRNVLNIVDAYRKEKQMGKDVVVISDKEIGVYCGMYLASAGHNVTMLTDEKELYPDNRAHYSISVIETYKDLKNFNIITQGKVTGISSGKVSYLDGNGEKKRIKTDNVVVFDGFKSKKDDAMRFYGSAKQYFTIGDCGEMGGNIQKCIRSAFFTATEL